MKNRLFVWALFTLAAFVAWGLTGCVTNGTTTKGTNIGNFGEHIRTPVKDFQSLGLVFTETRLAATDSGGDEGQIFTYQALLKEAQALGADAIINVVIDKKIQASTVSSFLDTTSSGSTTTWYGTALAIKYTAILTETGSVTVTANGATTTTETTAVYFNDGGATGTGSMAAKLSAGGQAPVPGTPPTPVPTRGIRQ
jgi:uncharacterized protein YbjQ (UPF0145 family)